MALLLTERTRLLQGSSRGLAKRGGPVFVRMDEFWQKEGGRTHTIPCYPHPHAHHAHAPPPPPHHHHHQQQHQQQQHHHHHHHHLYCHFVALLLLLFINWGILEKAELLSGQFLSRNCQDQPVPSLACDEI